MCKPCLNRYWEPALALKVRLESLLSYLLTYIQIQTYFRYVWKIFNLISWHIFRSKRTSGTFGKKLILSLGMAALCIPRTNFYSRSAEFIPVDEHDTLHYLKGRESTLLIRGLHLLLCEVGDLLIVVWILKAAALSAVVACKLSRCGLIRQDNGNLLISVLRCVYANVVDSRTRTTDELHSCRTRQYHGSWYNHHSRITPCSPFPDLASQR